MCVHPITTVIIIIFSATSTSLSISHFDIIIWCISYLDQHHSLVNQCYLRVTVNQCYLRATVLSITVPSASLSCLSLLHQSHCLVYHCYISITVLYIRATSTSLPHVSVLPQHHYPVYQCYINITVLCTIYLITVKHQFTYLRFLFIYIFIADNISIVMYITCVILCLFSTCAYFELQGRHFTNFHYYYK